MDAKMGILYKEKWVLRQRTMQQVTIQVIMLHVTWKNKDYSAKGSDAQSSCTKPDMEAESACLNNMQDFLQPKCSSALAINIEAHKHEEHVKLGGMLMHENEAEGEYLALNGARLNGKEMVAAGLATHFVPSEKLAELEKHLISLNSGNEMAVKSVIEEFSLDVKPDEESILNKQSTINKCFDKDSVEEILKSFEAEASIEGNGWINAVLKGLKRSSPTGLKITLRSLRLCHRWWC